MKCRELAIVFTFLCVVSYVVTEIVLICPTLFPQWYTLFFQCMVVLWLFLDNFTLAYDLRQAISAEYQSRSKVESLERKTHSLDSALSVNTARFRETLRKQVVDAENRLACTLNQVCIVKNQCRIMAEWLRIQDSTNKETSTLLCSAVELNNVLVSSESKRRSVTLELLHWRLLAYKAIAMYYIRCLGDSAHLRRRRMGRQQRSLSR